MPIDTGVFAEQITILIELLLSSTLLGENWWIVDIIGSKSRFITRRKSSVYHEHKSPCITCLVDRNKLLEYDCYGNNWKANHVWAQSFVYPLDDERFGKKMFPWQVEVFVYWMIKYARGNAHITRLIIFLCNDATSRDLCSFRRCLICHKGKLVIR